MIFWPDWNSLSSVKTWHTIFEIAGIAVLALLVGAEILAFKFGRRETVLMEHAESARIAADQEKYDDAERRHTAEIGGVKETLTEAQKKATESEKKLAELERLRAARHLTADQKAKITKFITDNYKGTGRFTIKANTSENDARAYADEIAALFSAAPINWQVNVDNAMILGADTSGIWVSIKSAESIPMVTGLLRNALADAGLPVRKDVEVGGGIPTPGEIWLTIGTKK